MGAVTYRAGPNLLGILLNQLNAGTRFIPSQAMTWLLHGIFMTTRYHGRYE
jgi:hypothetical protein